MSTIVYALGWFVPLSVIAYILSVFEVFPPEYHWLVGLVYIATVGIAIWRISLRICHHAERKGAREALQYYRAAQLEDPPQTQPSDQTSLDVREVGR
jgi:hypothetical protein